MNVRIIIGIFIFGGVGTLVRYGVQSITWNDSYAVFLLLIFINVFGSFLIGVFYQMIQHPIWRAVWTTGFCGGFTTMSTFAGQSIRLFEKGMWLEMMMYILMSVVVACLACMVGLRLFGKERVRT